MKSIYFKIKLKIIIKRKTILGFHWKGKIRKLNYERS